LLNVREAAQRLGAPERTVRHWCETGKLPAIPRPFGTKISYLISPLTIQIFLKAQQEQRGHQF
jgi:excisionase family DNA binding protein